VRQSLGAPLKEYLDHLREADNQQYFNSAPQMEQTFYEADEGLDNINADHW
jgi:hypothetical protein